MDLDLAASPALLVLCTVAAGAFAWWSYRRSVPRPTGARLGALVALRMAAFALVLFLLFEPVWTRVLSRGEAPLVAVLVDTSESLTVGTTGAAPEARVRSALDDLPADAALRFYTFDAGATPRGARLDADSLAFRGERTDIAQALERVEADFDGRNLRAVVVVSDGRVTDGRNPIYVAERSRVPVFTAVAGDSLSGRDVRLARVATNDVATVGSPLPIQAGIRATGFGGRGAQVRVTEGGRPVGTATVTLPPDGAEATVDLAVTPGSAGLKTYTVEAVPVAGEATARNNTQSVTVRVLSDTRQVLVVASGPSPDLSALLATLAADRGLDVTVRTQNAPGTYYQGPLPSGLRQFDLIVLSGFPGLAASDGDVSRLGGAIGAGVPAVFLYGRQTDLSKLARLGGVLPVVPEAARDGVAEGTLAPTPVGEAHPILTGLGAPSARLGALPPLAVSTSRWALQPGARVLATVRRGGAVLDTPLLSVRQAGSVRTVALLGAGTWRWRTLPDDLTDLAPVFPTLLSQSIRWTTAARDRRPVRVRADRALFGEREAVTFTGQVYTSELESVADATVQVTIRGQGGAPFRVSMRALGNGRYTASAGPRPGGAYTFTAEATRGGARLGDDRGTFGVGRLAAEFREPGADVATMRQMARRSGGAPVGLDTLGAFVRGLRASGALADRPFTRRDATPILGLWPLLALIVGLLTAEWIVRKRAGMV